MASLKTQQVATLIGKSGDQVRRYAKNGILHAVRNGKDLIFDRDDVLNFAQSRGIQVSEKEREVPQEVPFSYRCQVVTFYGNSPEETARVAAAYRQVS